MGNHHHSRSVRGRTRLVVSVLAMVPAAAFLAAGRAPAATANAGVITTVVGTGTAGFAGEEGPAETAQLREPRHLVVAADGSIYLADTMNHRIQPTCPRRAGGCRG